MDVMTVEEQHKYVQMYLDDAQPYFSKDDVEVDDEEDEMTDEELGQLEEAESDEE